MPDALARRIETDRLSLQPIRQADAEDLFEIMRDPAIGAAMGEPPPEDVIAAGARIGSWIAGPGSEHDERWLNWIARTPDGSPVAYLAATVQGSWRGWRRIVAVIISAAGTRPKPRWIRPPRPHGISAFSASIRESHAASEGVARDLGMLVTDEVIDGERVWRTPY